MFVQWFRTFVQWLRSVARPFTSSRGLRRSARWLGLALALFAGKAGAAQLHLFWVDTSGGTTVFRIERRGDEESYYEEIATEGPGVTAFTDADVTAGTTYCYRVRALNVVGSSPYSNEACGSPGNGTGLAIWVSVVGTQLHLLWVDDSGGGASFRVERKTNDESYYRQVAVQGPGVTSFVDTDVTAGITYCYRVRAYEVAGSSAYSNVTCGRPGNQTGMAITVRVGGTGRGLVTSFPSGISCGTNCQEVYPERSIVTLSARPERGSTFRGWSGGGCTGTDTCTLIGNTTATITATFARVSS